MKKNRILSGILFGNKVSEIGESIFEFLIYPLELIKMIICVTAKGSRPKTFLVLNMTPIPIGVYLVQNDAMNPVIKKLISPGKR